MRTAHLWVITQRIVILSYDVSGQPMDPIFRVQE